MRRRSAGPAVALFPFLAVLLCAMGALIFLLIVLARQVRQETLETRSADPAPVAPVVAIEPPASIPVVTVVVTPPPAPPPVDPNIALRARLEELTEAQVKAAQNVTQIRQAVEQKSNEAKERELTIASTSFDADAAVRRLEARTLVIDERAAKLREVTAAIERAKSDLSAAQKLAEATEPKVSIVPFDGRYGTARRPILIECTEEAIRFLPEGVELTATDLDGFQTDFNPLLAGVVALRKHWSAVDGAAAPNSYVLLLVRENGVAAYYAARAMLKSLDGETGYELISNELVLDVPEVDPLAREACREAVEEVLRSPSAGGSSLAGGGSLFPGGKFEVDPGEHDPTRGDASPLENRPPERRARSSLPPARPLGSGNLTGSARRSAGQPLPAGRDLPEGSLPSQRPLPTLASADHNSGEAGTATASRERSFSSDRPSGMPKSSTDRFGTKTGTGLGTGQGDTSSSQDFEEESDPLRMYGIAGAKRRWGQSSATSNIALERPIALRVTDDEITVGVQPTISLAEGITPEVMRKIVSAIDREADAWGPAPGQFYWLPRLTATVRPGGTGNLNQLERALGRTGLRVSSEIVLAPATPDFLELNHAETAP